jgi:hypothetical protein
MIPPSNRKPLIPACEPLREDTYNITVSAEGRSKVETLDCLSLMIIQMSAAYPFAQKHGAQRTIVRIESKRIGMSVVSMRGSE